MTTFPTFSTTDFASLSLLAHVLANLNARRLAVQETVLCPTRELADQMATKIRRLARAKEIVKVVVRCGGVAVCRCATKPPA